MKTGGVLALLGRNDQVVEILPLHLFTRVAERLFKRAVDRGDAEPVSLVVPMDDGHRKALQQILQPVPLVLSLPFGLSNRGNIPTDKKAMEPRCKWTSRPLVKPYHRAPGILACGAALNRRRGCLHVPSPTLFYTGTSRHD